MFCRISFNGSGGAIREKVVVLVFEAVLAAKGGMVLVLSLRLMYVHMYMRASSSRGMTGT